MGHFSLFFRLMNVPLDFFLKFLVNLIFITAAVLYLKHI